MQVLEDGRCSRFCSSLSVRLVSTALIGLCSLGNDLSDITLNSLQNSFLQKTGASNRQMAQVNQQMQQIGSLASQQMQQIGSLASQAHYSDPSIYSAAPLAYALPPSFFPQSYVRPFVGPTDGLFGQYVKLADSSSAAAAYRQAGAAAGVTGLATALPFLSQVRNEHNKLIFVLEFR